MKRSIIISSIIFTLVLCSLAPVSGIRISATQLVNSVNYHEGDHYQFSYTMMNNQNENKDYQISISPGDPSQQMIASMLTIEPPLMRDMRGGESRTFTVTLDFNGTPTSYGRNTMNVFVQEAFDPNSGMVAARSAVSVPIYVNVLYPGYKVGLSLKVHDVNVGEAEHAKVTITNLGESTIQEAYAEITFYDATLSIVGKGYTQKVRLGSFDSKVLNTSLDTTNREAGRYKAVAVVHYDGQQETIMEYFNIGAKDIDFGEFQKSMERGRINEYKYEITSKWNGYMEGVFGIVYFNNTWTKTPSIDLAPFETKNLTVYLDVPANYSAGPTDMILRADYGNGTKHQSIKVDILKAAHEEKALLLEYVNVTNILLLALILVIIIAMFRFRKKDNKDPLMGFYPKL